MSGRLDADLLTAADDLVDRCAGLRASPEDKDKAARKIARALQEIRDLERKTAVPCPTASASTASGRGEMDQYDREEAQLGRDYEAGRLTLKEYNAAMLELQRDYRDAAREAAERAAEDAYNREIDRW